MLQGSRRFSIMHAVKGGWAGQTFAQAKRNESGGRKSRTRLSKEERKKMVESFIKKYQILNNGNFPSLNLTHKEVGGSFYTIREIVREIIQENKVLGPAKSLLEEQDDDNLFKQYPLGTISTEPEVSLSLSPDGSSFVSYQHQDTTEELYLISDKDSAQPDKEQIVNGSHIIYTNKECRNVKAANDQLSEPRETKKSMEEMPLSGAEITKMADVTVETFPLHPVIQPTDKLDGNSVELSNLKGSLVEEHVEKLSSEPGCDISLSVGTSLSYKEVPVLRAEVTEMADVTVETFLLQPVTQTDKLDENSVEVMDSKGSLVEKRVEMVPSGPGYDISLSDGISLSYNSSLVNDKEVEEIVDCLLEEESRSLDGKAVRTMQDSSNSFATKNDVLCHTQVNIDVEVKPTHRDKAITETEVINTSKVIETKTLNDTYATTKSTEPTSQDEAIKGNKADFQHSGISQKRSNPTLDRINLESWEGASKTPRKTESNPVVATFKSIIAAFVKFWSD